MSCYKNQWGGTEHIPGKKIKDLDGGAIYLCCCGQVTFLATSVPETNKVEVNQCKVKKDG